MSNLVRVKRDGGRGHHLIDRAKYETDPEAFILVDDDGNELEAALKVGKGPGGKFYVKKGKERVAGPFDTEDEANAALSEPASGE